jgi:carboxypeptidase Q
MLLTFGAALLCSATLVAQASSTAWLDPYRPIAARILTESQASDFAWKRLAELTDTYGNRLSGSDTLEKAIDWATAEMKKDGLQNVHKESAMVPHWIRGRESLDLIEPVKQPMVLLGLGNSVGTPAGGIEAEVVVVKSYDDLTAHAKDVKGRIVLLNVPFTTYGETRPFRSDGPSKAAQLGAVAFLLRSVGPPGLRTPHTGATNYTTDAPKIPAAAIPTEDADRLQRLADRGVKTRVKLMMEAHFENDAQSYNVVGEIVGKDLPKEVLVMGGHIDSWDVGAGATDDGGGCVVTWEALRLIHKLDLHPRRTIRVVLFTNEENGTRGGNAYRDSHLADLPNHVLLLESDGGIFDPAGFGITFDPAKKQPAAVSDRAKQTVTAVASLLSSIGADHVTDGGEGTDIEPASTAGDVPMLSHLDTGDYFLIHHTAADTIARITPQQVSKNAAAIAVMMYTLADLPWRLGKEDH